MRICCVYGVYLYGVHTIIAMNNLIKINDYRSSE